MNLSPSTILTLRKFAMQNSTEGVTLMKGTIQVDYHQSKGSLPQKLLNIFKRMPIPQGIIVMIALGITVGTAMSGGLDVISKIAEVLALVSSFGLGFLSLWMLNIPSTAPTHEISNRSGPFVKVLNYAIIFIMIVNLFQIFDYGVSAYVVMFNLATMFFMLFVFLASLQIFVDKKR
jgi:hypothetical protein